MTTQELRVLLSGMGIDDNLYSLKGELLPDRIVLDSFHGNWIVFYFDERGNRYDEKKFTTENDACEYVLKLFENYYK